MKKPFTKKQYEYYTFYINHIKKNWYSPTYDIMSEHFKKSRSVIFYWLHRALEKVWEI